MNRIQLFIVILLGAAILGGGGYFVYDALHPYRNVPRQPPAVYVPLSWAH